MPCSYWAFETVIVPATHESETDGSLLMLEMRYKWSCCRDTSL